jgi:hypothetical protein
MMIEGSGGWGYGLASANKTLETFVIVIAVWL